MNGPAWPGQPPGPPGYPPGPPPGGPGGFPPPPPPPPRKGGGGLLVPLLIFGAVAVLAIVGLGAFVVLQSDDDEDDPPPVTLTSPEPRYSSSTPAPTQSSAKTLDDILTPTFETAKGNTFTRVGTRTASCPERSNEELKVVLRDHPCDGDMRSAVYADSGKKIMTAVSILPFSTSTDARNIKDATSDKGWPLALPPSTESGLPQPDTDTSFWTRTWAMDDFVIYAQSYYLDGTHPGSRTGEVYGTASEIGVEVTNVLRFAF